ncbi:argininosuccinate lyase [Candidatus Vidania fulgoroideorum]
MKWSKRFNKSMSIYFKKYTFSLSKDIRLIKEEKKSIKAHTIMLKKIGIISNKDKDKLIKNIKLINKKDLDLSCEDIHFALEKVIQDKLGKLSSKIRIARSRNDLSTNCLKMWVKKKNKKIIKILKKLTLKLIKLSKINYNTIMPSFTHCQIAQPITLGHYFLAFCEMFYRDMLRVKYCIKINDNMPLGSCAIAGTNLRTDRNIMKKILNYNSICRNSLDAVSDRDYITDTIYCYSMIIIHITRICEDFILWSNKIYNFLEISDAYCSGSSLMPQKKNPDVLEVARSKSGRIIGNLINFFLIIKSLPMGYNKDCQEDKNIIFDSYDNIKSTLIIIKKILVNTFFNKKEMYNKSKLDFSNSTDIAEFLSINGLPYKISHGIVSNSVNLSIINKKEITFNVLKLLKNKIKKNKYLFIKKKIKFFLNFKKNIYLKKSLGSTNPLFVLRECKKIKKKIEIL